MSTKTAGEAPVEPQELPKELWTYLGERYSQGKLYACWQDADGHERYYDKKRNGIIGSQYELEVERTDEKVLVIFGTKRHRGQKDEPGVVGKWRAESAAANAAEASDKLEAKLLKENSDLDAMTLGELRAMMRRRRGYKNRSSMLAVVYEYLTS